MLYIIFVGPVTFAIRKGSIATKLYNFHYSHCDMRRSMVEEVEVSGPDERTSNLSLSVINAI